jgi:nitrogen-specific signal transduction histidine kinase
VPHHDKPGVPKELLHEVNNQFEIIVGAAECLSRQSSDPSTKHSCEQIQSAVFRTSKLLKTYFQEAVSSQAASHEVSETVSPVVLDGPDQGCLAGKSPANTLL